EAAGRTLAWVRGADLAEHQRKLAYQYLARGDYLRAAIFGWEAFVSRPCLERQLDPQKRLAERSPGSAVPTSPSINANSPTSISRAAII
ncbi:hypothetical protein, partial [Streptococcus pneumoniae]|uniref:hypothetical protein n=1 Tax=Streptococcus pneumoniae TaxID=1313 RepID=UPI001CB77CF7